jgi:hypothetical protein
MSLANRNGCSLASCQSCDSSSSVRGIFVSLFVGLFFSLLLADSFKINLLDNFLKFPALPAFVALRVASLVNLHQITPATSKASVSTAHTNTPTNT